MTDSTNQTMTRTEIKDAAKKELLIAMGTVFYSLFESGQYDEETANLISAEADRQMERIEKLLGFTPGSFMRG